MKLFQLLSTLAFTSSALAGCKDVRIEGGGHSGRLECQLEDGTWGTVCMTGFGPNAARAACSQMGYCGTAYYKSVANTNIHGYSSQLPVAICQTDCRSYDSRFSYCTVRYYPDDCYCSHREDIIISCHNEYNCDGGYDYDDSSGSSSGAVIGATIGGLLVCGVVVLLVICCVYVRYSYIRRQDNQTYVITQQRPRILIARVTRTTTVPPGPPPPPPYTPTQPTNHYTPVPPRDYQPVATDDYTTTPTAPSSDVPSEPPPEYTPSVFTDDVSMLTVL
ncbi:uncharacterized protein [Dysidea avara]|uniref:uncharacterized protein n=1 Tax=Dysidea avara TaxID=196820 RepID=UPI00331A0A34